MAARSARAGSRFTDPDPTVSVLMPVRNGEQYLSEAIDSLLAQTFDDFEIVIVDDGSSDQTASILSTYAARDPRLRVLRQNSLGLVAALNNGLGSCRAPLVARMDGDDVAFPDRLAAQFAFLARNPRVVAVGAQVDIIDGTGRKLRRGRYPVGVACDRHLMHGSPFCHSAVMFRRWQVRHIGGYREAYRYAEDMDLWLRLATIGSFDNLPVPLLRYRVHSASVTALHPKKQAAASALAFAAAAVRASGLPDPTPDDCSPDQAWSAIESFNSARFTAVARSSYFRALALNGGIAERASLAAFEAEFDQLTAEAREILNDAPGFAFTLTRAAVQLCRSGCVVPGLRILARGWAYAPRATLNELRRSYRSRKASDAVH